jgi:excisionase family DNA binding protein
MVTDPKFWTAAEAATITRVSKMTIYRLLHSGELASIRVGRSFRIPDAALTAYLNPTPTQPTANGNAPTQSATQP